MVKVIKQLCNPKFHFVLLGKWNLWARYENVKGNSKMVETREVNPIDFNEYKKNKEWKPLGKAPFEMGWQKKQLVYDSEAVEKHEENLGIICGPEKLRILDVDDEKLGKVFEPLMDTFTIQTGSGGKHFYFISDWDKNEVLVNGLGEVRANNYQVVCPPSRHPNGNPYVVHIDKPIREISKEDFLEIVKPYLRNSQPKEQSVLENSSDSEHVSEGTPEQRDTSRSAQEMKEIIKLILKGYSKNAVFKRMMFYAKWSSSPEGYRELTFKKAMEHVKKIYEEQEEEKPEVEINLEVYDDKELLQYEPKSQKWLIENQIPENEIGLLVGKRGERKTFTALYQALCLASGKECLDDKIPEPKKIVFVTEEDSIDTLVSRIKPLKKSLGLENKELPIKYLSFNGLKLDRDDQRYNKFKLLLKEFTPDLIIIDALQRCVTFEIDKDNRSISELFTERIRPLMKETGGTWLFISHLRKGLGNGNKSSDPLDEVRGGSELVNYARFVLSCETPRYQTKTEEGGDFVLFRVLKMSASQIKEPKVISFTNVEGGIRVSYEGLPEDVLAGEVQCANAIKDWLFANQNIEFQTRDVNNASEEIGFKKTLISSGLKLLIKQGIIKKVKKGHYEVIGKISDEIQPKQRKLIEDKLEISDDELEELAEQEELKND